MIIHYKYTKCKQIRVKETSYKNSITCLECKMMLSKIEGRISTTLLQTVKTNIKTMKKTKDLIRIEALTEVRKYKRCTAAISMGVGKTRLGLEHFQIVMDKIANERLTHAKGLVVAPTIKILKGWKEEADKWGLSHLIEDLTFTTYLSMKKQSNDYDVVYLDECQALKYSHDKWLTKHEGIILGLTGTPPKNEFSEKGKMVEKYCPVKYTYVMNDAVDDHILNDYRITIHMLELGSSNNYRIQKKNKKTGELEKEWFTSEISNYKYWTDCLNNAERQSQIQMMSILRMKAMQGYTSKETYAKKLLDQSSEKCILFANTQEQADKLCQNSYHANNSNSTTNLVKFEKGIIRKLSCVMQLSEGANIKGLKECIIMHSYGNNRQSSQRLARTLRLNPTEKAHCHILCYKGTVDEKWVKAALEDFDQSKITYYDPDIF